MTTAHVMYVTECDHVNLCAPTLIQRGNHIWCAQCKDDKKITGVHVFEWHLMCLVCRYSRWTGTSEHMSQRLAGAHERTTLHKTEVSYARNPNAVDELNRLRKAKAL